MRELLSVAGEPLWAVDERVRRLEHRVAWLEQQIRRLSTAVGEVAGTVATDPASLDPVHQPLRR